MNQQTVLEIAAPHCVAQDFDGEIVVLNMNNGTYYSLRDLGAALWRDLASGRPVEVLADLSAARLGGPRPVFEFAEKAQAEGLLRPAAGAAAQGTPEIAAALAGGGSTDLTFEVYEDMKNLILLDPVHEVDEARGWPALPKDA